MLKASPSCHHFLYTLEVLSSTSGSKVTEYEHVLFHACLQDLLFKYIKIKATSEIKCYMSYRLYLCVSHILIKYIELKISIYWEMLLQVNKHINSVFHL